MCLIINRGLEWWGTVWREAAWIGTDSEGQSALMFTRAGSEFFVEPAPAGQRMGYRLHDGTLEVVYWPRIDHGDGTRPFVYPLVTNIAEFRLQYLATDRTWHDRWPLLGEDAIPRAVRLTLTLADGARIDRWFALR